MLENHSQKPNENAEIGYQSCPACQAPVDKANRFCTNCGYKITSSPKPNTLVCHRCSFSNPINFKYCANCGVALILSRVVKTEEKQLPTSRQYYLESDGVIPKEKGGVFRQLLPAFFIFMLSSLGLIAYIGAFLLLYSLGLYNEDNDSLNMLFQIIATLVPTIALTNTYVLSRFGLTKDSIGLTNELDPQLTIRAYLIMTLLVVIVAITLQVILTMFLTLIGSEPEQVTPYPSIGTKDPGFLLLWILAAVIIGPIYEEILARGYLIPLLEKRGCSPIVAILGSSIIFSGLHLQADLLTMVEDGTTVGAIEFPLSHGVSTFIIGCVFGIVYYASGRSLKTTIVLHMINNGVATIILASGDISVEAQVSLGLIYILLAFFGGGYFAYLNWGYFVKEFEFVKTDFYGRESAFINYIFAIYFVALLPIIFIFFNPLLYIAWYILGGFILLGFLLLQRQPVHQHGGQFE